MTWVGDRGVYFLCLWPASVGCDLRTTPTDAGRSQKGSVMATLFKPTRPYPLPAKAEILDKDGKPHVRIREGAKATLYPLTKDRTKYLKPAAKWYAKYRDANRTVRCVPLSPNKDAAQLMLTDLLKKAEQEKAGVRDEYADHRKRPLTDLLTEYECHQRDRGNTSKQAGQTRRRCEIVFEGCGFTLLCELDATSVERWLSDRRALPKQKGGLSPQTSNHYLTALKALGNWLVKARRLPENPFRHLAGVNVEVDIRHVRRALSAAEFARLVEAARSGIVYRGLPGPDRAVLYTVAGMTGLRASELASLTKSSFTVDADPPVVVVAAGYSKHRRRDEVPLHPDLVAELRSWLGSKQPRESLWPGKWAKQCSAAAMIRRDLEAARRAWIGESGTAAEKQKREESDFLAYRHREEGIADFHSLRHTFITNLVNAGVMPKDAKELARHSTITLTMDRYAHVGIRDTAAALARLTMPTTQPGTDSATLQATGTDSRCTADVPADVPAGGNGRLRLRTDENIRGGNAGGAGTSNPLENQGVEDDRGLPTSGEGGNLLAPLFAPLDDYRLIALIHWKNKAFAASHRSGHEPDLSAIVGAKTGLVCTKRAPTVHREMAEKGRPQIKVRILTTLLRQNLLRQLINGDTAGVAAGLRARPLRPGVPQPGGRWAGGSETRLPRRSQHRPSPTERGVSDL